MTRVRARSLVLRVRPLVPPRIRGMMKRVPRLLDPLAVRRYRRRTQDHRPVPPKLLRERTGAPTIARWFEIGERCATALSGAAERSGRAFAESRSILDFGCGAGKVLQALYSRLGARLAGCDIHEPSIAWLRAHYLLSRFEVNDFTPPLRFRDGEFDLVYALSVFTHLDELRQDAWLRELARVAAPEAILLLTIHGEHALRRDWSGPGLTRSSSDRLNAAGPLDDEGFLFQAYDELGSSPKDYCGTEETYGLAFHSPAYVSERWTGDFEVLDILPAAVLDLQDIVVLRRR